MDLEMDFVSVMVGFEEVSDRETHFWHLRFSMPVLSFEVHPETVAEGGE